VAALNKPRPGQGVTKKSAKPAKKAVERNIQNNGGAKPAKKKIVERNIQTQRTYNQRMQKSSYRPGAQNKNKIQTNKNNKNRNNFNNNTNTRVNNRKDSLDNLKIKIFNPKATPSPHYNHRESNSHTTTPTGPNGRSPSTKYTGKRQTSSDVGGTNSKIDSDSAVQLMHQFVDVLKDIKDVIPALKNQQNAPNLNQQVQARRQPLKRQRTFGYNGVEEVQPAAVSDEGSSKTLNDIFAAVSKGDKIYTYY